MTKTFLLLTLGLGLLALIPKQGWAINFYPLYLSVEGHIKEIKVVDLNYDGLKDLLVIHIKGLPPRETRWISIFWQRHNRTFSPVPDQSWQVEPTATVLDVGEISPRYPGQELVLLTSEGVKFYPLLKDKYSQEALPLIHHPVFTPFPEEDNLPITNFVQDWDQDGNDDIAIMDFGRLAIFFGNGKGDFSRKEVIQVKIEPFYLGYDPLDKSRDPSKVPLFTSTYFFPELNLRDYDGDGLKDLIAIQKDVLYWYPHHEGNGFATSFIKKDFDIRTEKEKREELVNIKMMVEDLDGDGLADVLINKQKARGLSSLFSLVSIFYNRRGRGLPLIPDQMIITEGTASVAMVIRDLNHDGKKDLILPSFQFGLGAILRYFFTKKIKVNFLVYLMGKDGRYPDRPDLEKAIKFKIDLSGQSNLAVIDPDGDYNGDGIEDLVFGTDEDELSIFLGIANRGGRIKKIYEDKPAVRLKVNTLGYLITEDLSNRGRSDLILYYPRNPKRWHQIIVFLNR